MKPLVTQSDACLLTLTLNPQVPCSVWRMLCLVTCTAHFRARKTDVTHAVARLTLCVDTMDKAYVARVAALLGVPMAVFARGADLRQSRMSWL